MGNKQRLISFGTFCLNGKNEMEVMMTTSDERGKGYLSVELPDAIFGFKNCRISYPDLVIEKREGFTDSEMSNIINLFRDNINIIKRMGKEGVVY